MPLSTYCFAVITTGGDLNRVPCLLDFFIFDLKPYLYYALVICKSMSIFIYACFHKNVYILVYANVQICMFLCIVMAYAYVFRASYMLCFVL